MPADDALSRPRGLYGSKTGLGRLPLAPPSPQDDDVDKPSERTCCAPRSGRCISPLSIVFLVIVGLVLVVICAVDYTNLAIVPLILLPPLGIIWFVYVTWLRREIMRDGSWPIISNDDMLVRMFFAGFLPGAVLCLLVEAGLSIFFALICLSDQLKEVMQTVARDPQGGSITRHINGLQQSVGFYFFVLLTAFVTAATTEEIVKLLIVRLACLPCLDDEASLCVQRRKRYASAKVLAYATLSLLLGAAVGFSLAENLLYTFTESFTQPGQPKMATLGSRAATAFVRGIISLPVHCVCVAFTALRLTVRDSQKARRDELLAVAENGGLFAYDAGDGSGGGRFGGEDDGGDDDAGLLPALPARQQFGASLALERRERERSGAVRLRFAGDDTNEETGVAGGDVEAGTAGSATAGGRAGTGASSATSGAAAASASAAPPGSEEEALAAVEASMAAIAEAQQRGAVSPFVRQFPPSGSGSLATRSDSSAAVASPYAAGIGAGSGIGLGIGSGIGSCVGVGGTWREVFSAHAARVAAGRVRVWSWPRVIWPAIALHGVFDLQALLLAAVFTATFGDSMVTCLTLLLGVFILFLALWVLSDQYAVVLDTLERGKLPLGVTAAACARIAAHPRCCPCCKPCACCRKKTPAGNDSKSDGSAGAAESESESSALAQAATGGSAAGSGAAATP